MFSLITVSQQYHIKKKQTLNNTITDTKKNTKINKKQELKLYLNIKLKNQNMVLLYKSILQTYKVSISAGPM